MNSYSRVKEHIFENLRKYKGTLPVDGIQNEIDNCKLLITNVGLQTFAQFLPDKTDLSELSDDDWNRMSRELGVHFDVKMNLGILIQGDSQQHRDTTWWTSKQKQQKENYYWGRYKLFIESFYPEEVIRAIDTDTDLVMNNLENPEIESFNRYGMVVGHVQSGKTANYSALVCKAADAGYNFIVVVAGGMNNLRNQTQERLNEAFIGLDMGTPVGVGVGNVNREKLPISLTTKEKDFNKADADRNSQGLNFDNINVPIVIVIKKNTRSLLNVIEWLERQYKNQIKNHTMLLIDDESDYASINTKEEEDPTTINKRLRKLISLFEKSAYVAYTATPYANIFIDHEVGHDELGKDLFPKDFIYALDAPSNYFGARKIFLDDENKYLIQINDYLDDIPVKHKKDLEIPKLPNSLFEAIRLFIINISIRNLRGQGGKHNSMLVHATRFTNVHKRIAFHIEKYLNHLHNEINAYGMLNNALNQSKKIRDIRDTFELHCSDSEFTWDDVLESICKTISSIVVREVHQSTTVPLEYRDDTSTNAIVVGGTSLARGYTLEGLSISYFLRNTVFYDTLMQMGRWFGYRDGYDDLCKIFLPTHVKESFSLIIDATEDLIDNLKLMSNDNMTPEDFGLAVKHHPDSGLQVTARNKQKNTKDIYFDMKLDGHAKETAWLHNEDQIKAANLTAIGDIIRSLSQKGYVSNKKRSSYLWSEIDKLHIIDFLNNFKVFGSEDELGIRTRMPIKFIMKYAVDMDCKWDVALYSGEGDSYYIPGSDVGIKKEKRKLEDAKGNYHEVKRRQVSSGSSEAIVLDDATRKLVGSKRKEIRAIMKRPLLMLHILETDEDHSLAAFGISFPGGINSGNHTVRLKINPVYIASLAEDDEYDD